MPGPETLTLQTRHQNKQMVWKGKQRQMVKKETKRRRQEMMKSKMAGVHCGDRHNKQLHLKKCINMYGVRNRKSILQDYKHYIKRKRKGVGLASYRYLQYLKYLSIYHTQDYCKHYINKALYLAWRQLSDSLFIRLLTFRRNLCGSE